MVFGRLFKKSKYVKHAAIEMQGVTGYAKGTNMDSKKAVSQAFDKAFEIIQTQIKLNIPVLTFYVKALKSELEIGGEFAAFLMKAKEYFKDNKVKVSVIGKWYSEGEALILAVRKVSEETKDYDSFFVNFCVQYDGQEEIVDAIKIIARKVKMGSIDPDMISKDTVKEELYSSLFIPPDVIIRNGQQKAISSFLLWDVPGSRTYFTHKSFNELRVKEFEKYVRQPL